MRIVFKAQLGDGPVQVVGDYEPTPEEWADELDTYGSQEDWLMNAGSEWAYEAVHSDCLRYWAEVQ